MIGKIASCSCGTFLAGYPAKVALPVGMGMAQIGEFSFIIANLGRASGVTSGALYPIAVAVSSLTTFLTPYLLRSAHSVTALLGRFSPRPLVTFATFYTAWLSRLTDRTSGSGVVRSQALRLTIYLAATVALFVAVWSMARTLASGLPVIVPRQTELLQWGNRGPRGTPLSVHHRSYLGVAYPKRYGLASSAVERRGPARGQFGS